MKAIDKLELEISKWEENTQTAEEAQVIKIVGEMIEKFKTDEAEEKAVDDTDYLIEVEMELAGDVVHSSITVVNKKDLDGLDCVSYVEIDKKNSKEIYKGINKITKIEHRLKKHFDIIEGGK